MVKATAKNIKRLRRNLGLSKSDLARLCEVDRAAVTRWELGKTSPRYTDRVAKVLKCRVQDLYA